MVTPPEPPQPLSRQLDGTRLEGSPHDGTRRDAPLRIGNASGFYGDRLSAMREMLDGGPLDVLTGDYLAELTMLILGRARQRDPDGGYAGTFLRQLEACLEPAVRRGVRLVSNAGGLAPAALAGRIAALAERLGLDVRVGHVTGDDLLPRATEFGFGAALTANAYLGGFGIAACLRAGADVVVTGRVTDAALTLGPAAAHFGWDPDNPADLHALAGAVAAGHVIECGAQATGGNLAGFARLAGLGPAAFERPLGFPIAEVYPDGSAVITKHPGTGGAVTVDTVTAQLLYEVSGHRYPNPDVTLRLDTVRVTQDGPDRVRLHGARGEPPPPSLKVGLNSLGGFRNEITFVLTGLDIPAKADLVRRQVEAELGRSGARRPRLVEWRLDRTDHPDSDTEAAASALLQLSVQDPDPAVAGRAVSGLAVELALASYPGFHLTAPPADARPFGVFTAVAVPQTAVEHVAVLADGSRLPVPPPARTRELPGPDEPGTPDERPGPGELPGTGEPGEQPGSAGPTRRVPLGELALARSGDKGGDANIGVWVGSGPAYRWLSGWLTPQRVRELLPEASGCPVRCYRLPELNAVNVVIEGLLGQGVAASTRFDPQGKALGEWLRARLVDIPEELL